MRRRSRPPLSASFCTARIHGRTNREWMLENAKKAIEEGETSFRFWQRQSTVSYPKIERKTGIDQDRLRAFDYGEAHPSKDEAALLASVLSCEPSDLLP